MIIKQVFMGGMYDKLRGAGNDKQPKRALSAKGCNGSQKNEHLIRLQKVATGHKKRAPKRLQHVATGHNTNEHIG